MASAALDMSVSGQFSRAGVDDASPGPEFTKITEGFAAVLFPPAKQHNKAGRKDEENETTENKGGKKKSTTEGSGHGGEKDGNCTGFFINNEAAGEDDQAVFYNPAQVVNRDLTICVMETFSRQRRTEPLRKGGVGDRGITIVEALSASGLRSIRYWKEITGLKYIIANDLDPDAVECMKRNLAYNNIPIGHATLTGNTPSQEWRGVVPNEDDAIVLMQRLGLEPSGPLRTVGVKVIPPKNVNLGDRPTILGSSTADVPTSSSTTTTTSAEQPEPQPQLVPLLQCDKMDIVDLDPYGTASPFLESAMQCVKEGGLMCITSTDSSILCGTYPETGHAKYNSVAIRHTACHEMAVRILLAAVERTANKHKKFIVPLLSLHIDFYVRIFIRVYTQPAEVKLAICKLAHYFKCTRCPNFAVTPLGRIRVHGKKNSDAATDNADDGAAATADGQARGGKKNQKKEHRAAKRAREEAEAAAVAASAGNSGAVDASTTEVAENEQSDAPVAAAGPSTTEPLDATTRDINHPPVFHDFTRMAPNVFPPNHDRAVPFSVNPSTIRNISYECCVCHGAMAIAGPIYAAPIHNHEFLTALDAVITERHDEKRLTATNRIRGLVAAARDELPNAPMFVEVPEIASLVKIPTPPLPEFVAAVSRLGYKCSQVHCNHSGLKTEAPVDVLVGLMMDYKMKHLGGEEGTNGDDATKGQAVTSTATTDNIGRQIFVPAIAGDFTYSKDFDFRRLGNGVTKFVQNAPGWGPKARHRGVARGEDDVAVEEATE